jgi:hypothetical protein
MKVLKKNEQNMKIGKIVRELLIVTNAFDENGIEKLQGSVVIYSI